MTTEVYTCKDNEDIGNTAGSIIHSLVRKHTAEKGAFTLVLSGGKTPEILFSKLTGHEFITSVPWEKVMIFWGDERYVSKDHEDSNYRLAYDALLSKVPIPEENIFPVPTELSPVEKVAEMYEKTLRDFFSSTIRSASPMPVFDLILLGLGKDGHTASLYPGNPVADDEKRWVSTAIAPDWAPVKKRITLTLPVINSADTVMFLVSGSEKKEVLCELLQNEQPVRPLLPAQMVKPRGRLIWVTDISVA